MTDDSIGVDISKAKLDCHRLSDGAFAQFPNTKSGYKNGRLLFQTSWDKSKDDVVGENVLGVLMGAVMGVVGLAYGIMAVEEDRRVYFLVMTVTLGMAAGSLGGIPAVGGYLTTMLTTLGGFAAAGSIGVIVKGMVERLT